MSKFYLSIIVLGASTATAIAADRICGRPVRIYCSLPCYQYAHRPTSNPRSETSHAFLPRSFDEQLAINFLAQSSPNAVRTTKVKVFQLARADITNDNCQLNNVSMAIMDDGTWTLRCVAVQNANLVEETLRPRFFNYKRNGFHVTVDGVGEAAALDPPETRVLGQPSYFQVAPTPFWINAGEQRNMVWSGQSDSVRRFFPLVERIDVALRYE